MGRAQPRPTAASPGDLNRRTRTQLDSTRVPAAPAECRTLRIVQVERNFRGQLDGKPLLEAEDDEFPDEGRVGLWTKADTVTDFEHLTARPSSAKELEDLPTPTE